MSISPRSDPARLARPLRWLSWWLVALNAALIAAGVVLVWWGFRRAVFLTVLAPVAFAPFAYARLRLQRLLARFLATHAGAAAAPIATAITAAGVALDVVMVAQLLTARSNADTWNGPPLFWIGPVWFSAHALLFVGYVMLGVARGGWSVAAALRAHAVPSPPPSPASVAGEGAGSTTRECPSSWGEPQAHEGSPASPAGEGVGGDVPIGRRQFLQQFAVAGAGVPFAVSLSGARLSYDFRVEEREIALPHWPRRLDGLRVAHLSDIHVGGAMNRQRLLRVAELTAAARPDLVLHTGDFLTHRSGDFDDPLYEALARIAAPYGQWACLGNHDFDDPRHLVLRLRDAGVTALRNALATVAIDGQPLEIAGIDFLFDRARRTAQYPRIVAAWTRRDTAPRLLLNHDPTGFAHLPDGCADLVLSGHTHGGHIGIQLGPSHALTVVALAGIPDQGVFRRGNMQMFVTRCVGFYGYPMRLGIPPEIAILTLRADPGLRSRAA